MCRTINNNLCSFWKGLRDRVAVYARETRISMVSSCFPKQRATKVKQNEKRVGCGLKAIYREGLRLLRLLMVQNAPGGTLRLYSWELQARQNLNQRVGQNVVDGSVFQVENHLRQRVEYKRGVYF